jgi:hypothetical protein
MASRHAGIPAPARAPSLSLSALAVERLVASRGGVF